MHQGLRTLWLSLALTGTAGLISGCANEADNPAAKTAENAVGIHDERASKTVQTTRDVNVVKDTKVIDAKTGQTISETKEVTPVKITKELEEKVNVDVNVGDTKATVKTETVAPPK